MNYADVLNETSTSHIDKMIERTLTTFSAVLIDTFIECVRFATTRAGLAHIGS